MTLATTLLLAVSFLPYFEARNQVANYLVTPPDTTAEITKPAKPEPASRKACPTCEGKGKLKIQEPDYGQNKGRLNLKSKKITVPCARCQGRKQVMLYDMTSLKQQVARDFETYTLNHQTKGEMPVGCAFVPQADYETIDKKKLKLIENTFGKPCTSCHWLGLTDCKKCRGEGVRKCSEERCRNGFIIPEDVENENNNSYSRRTKKITLLRKFEVCTTCGGTEQERCSDCAGRGALPCEKCHGIGYKQKNTAY